MAEVKNNLTGLILGLGNPLLDISAVVSPEFIQKYGLKSNDAILCEKQHLPIYKELSDLKNVDYIAGGAAQNAIRVCQWMVGVSGVCSYIGCIGNDMYGQRLLSIAKADGVSVYYQVKEGVPTGTCACLIHDKDRSMVANLGAATHFNQAHFQSEELKTVVSRANIFYIEGFFLTSSFTSCMYLAGLANDNNKVLALNLSAFFICQAKELVTILPYVDYLFGNESEAIAFAKSRDWKVTDVASIALQLSQLPKTNVKRKRVVVITQGANPTVVATDNTTSSFAVPTIDSELIVDTNGAGDAFVGGFLAALILAKPTQYAVQAGHYAARSILQVSGTKLPISKPAFTL